jgi:hypothetical protein
MLEVKSHILRIVDLRLQQLLDSSPYAKNREIVRAAFAYASELLVIPSSRDFVRAVTMRIQRAGKVTGAKNKGGSKLQTKQSLVLAYMMSVWLDASVRRRHPLL